MKKMDSTNWNSVYAMVKKIPRGRVLTYGQLAKAVRLSGGARTAGRAMAACPSGKGVPWHRVVGAGGKLLIREPHASLQRKLLESEGLTLAEKRILNFSNYSWDKQKTRVRKTTN
jgi:methylated-DNA-protein-cysteine methyltransferase-like protein